MYEDHLIRSDLSVCFDDALNRIKKKNEIKEIIPSIPKNPVKKLIFTYCVISLEVLKSLCKAILEWPPAP